MVKGIILESGSTAALISEVSNDKIINYQYVFTARELSNNFFSFLKNIKNDFSYIGVGIGPGSYTGVRVSLTIAKSFSYALKIPIVSFYSLESFVPEEDGDFLSIFDAKIGGVYALHGQKKQNKIQFSKPKLYSIEEILSLISKTPKIISPDVEILKKRIYCEKNTHWLLEKPNKEALAKMCFGKYLNKNFTPIESLNPIYLREA